MKGDIGILLGRTEDLPQMRQNIKEQGESIVALQKQDQSQPSTSLAEKRQPATATSAT